MDTSDLLHAVRRQISDVEKSFLQTILATGGTNRYTLDYAPIRASSVQVHVDSVDVSDACAVEEHTGTVIFDVPPTKNQVIAVAGMHTRFFTDSELEKICQDAFEMHTHNRGDLYGRPITLARLDAIEDLPVQILCSIQALYVLLTDSAYDIDINAPDGVNIPRSQRFRQLFEMLQTLEGRYRELSSMLGVGMYAIEVFSYRRISKRTNRYVPIWRPQEIDDRSMPQRVHLPIPTYGGQIIDDGIPDHDLTVYRGDTFKELVTVEATIPENARLRGHIKRYRGASIVVAEFGITRVDEHTVLLYLPHNRSEQFPERCVYDVQMETAGPGGFNADYDDDFEKREITTLFGGSLICPKDVTTPRMTDYTQIPEVMPIATGPHYSPSTGSRGASSENQYYGTR